MNWEAYANICETKLINADAEIDRLEKLLAAFQREAEAAQAQRAAMKAIERCIAQSKYDGRAEVAMTLAVKAYDDAHAARLQLEKEMEK